MRFFHLSDLHIGKLLYRYNLTQDQRVILGQIVALAKQEKPDAILMAGDIYDKPVPSAEAVALFDDFLTALSEITPQIPILIISGNHDSAQRLEYASSILKKERVYVAGMPPQGKQEHIRKVTLSDDAGEVDFYLLPFIRPAMVRCAFDDAENEALVKKARESGRSEYDVYFEALLKREKIDTSRRNVLLTHQFFVSGTYAPERTDSEIMTVGTLDQIDTGHLSVFDYVAMGHIHRPQKCGSAHFRYSGCPMAYSVSEEKDEKAITVVTLGDKGKEVEISYLPLIPERRVRKIEGSLQEVLSFGYSEDYVSILLTDEVTERFVMERIRECYPHYLEIVLQSVLRRKEAGKREMADMSMDFETLFAQFFAQQNGREMTQNEKELFEMVYHMAREDDET